jgi:methionyl-tRNA synthetase
MTARYSGGIVATGGPANADDQALRDSLKAVTAEYRAAMDAFDIAEALKAINRHVTVCNAYAERNKPWELAKDPAHKPRLDSVLAHLVESLAHCAILLSPVLPDPAARIAAQLRMDGLLDLKLDALQWGLVADGHETGKPKPVFPKILTEEV